MEKRIRGIVRESVKLYADNFERRHIKQVNDPSGVINIKIHNAFIALLRKEIQYYTALVRSLDSSLGNMLEKMAIDIAGLSYEVNRSIEGSLASG